jgi:phosphoribosylformylglycinamidine synthase
MKEFNISAIGGKDSMSGTFNELHVPPTLISFAFNVVDANNVISTDFKKSGNYIYLFTHSKDKNEVPNLSEIKNNFKQIQKYISMDKISSAFAIEKGGIAAALAKMSFGNDLGFNISTSENLFSENYGAIIVESQHKLDALLLGTTSKQ